MIRLGDRGKRAIIAVYLTPESAEDVAHAFSATDGFHTELMDAAERARLELGEGEE